MAWGIWITGWDSFAVSLLTINTKRIVDRDTQNLETPGEIQNKKMAKKKFRKRSHLTTRWTYTMSIRRKQKRKLNCNLDYKSPKKKKNLSSLFVSPSERLLLTSRWFFPELVLSRIPLILNHHILTTPVSAILHIPYWFSLPKLCMGNTSNLQIEPEA